MMFWHRGGAKRDGFQMIGGAYAVYPVRKGFYGSNGFIQCMRLDFYLPHSAETRPSNRPLLPFAAKISIPVAIKIRETVECAPVHCFRMPLFFTTLKKRLCRFRANDIVLLGIYDCLYWIN